MEVNEKIRNLLKKGGLKKKPFALKLGLDPSYFNKMLDGSRRWQLEYLEAIAHHFQMGLWELLRPEGQGEFRPPHALITILGTEPDSSIYIDAEQYLAVPLVEGPIAAGYAGAIPGDHVKSLVWVYQPEVGNRHHHNLRAVQLAKDARSMEPTIRAGGIVIVDPVDIHPILTRKIYAVRLEDDTCAVKRIRWTQKEDYVVLLSDNPEPLPEYEPVVIPKDRAENLIVGRVIWSWNSWVK